jgi:hypothetical protein
MTWRGFRGGYRFIDDGEDVEKDKVAKREDLQAQRHLIPRRGRWQLAVGTRLAITIATRRMHLARAQNRERTPRRYICRRTGLGWCIFASTPAASTLAQSSPLSPRGRRKSCSKRRPWLQRLRPNQPSGTGRTHLHSFPPLGRSSDR